MTRPRARHPTVAAVLVAALSIGLLVGCAREESAGPPAGSTAPAAAVAASTAPAPPPDEGTPDPGRASLIVGGDRGFSADAAVDCRLTFDPAAAADRPSLQVTLAPDDPVRPKVLLTVPEFDAAGDYAAAASLRLDTTDGTFTESTGGARMSVATVADGGGPPRISGDFTASFAGAAGEGRAAGRFGLCRLDLD